MTVGLASWEPVSGSASLMSEFETVGKVGDFEEGVGQAMPVDGRMVAAFLRDGQFYATDDLSPHMGHRWGRTWGIAG